MKSITMTYLGFQKLLDGIERLLTTLQHSLFGAAMPALAPVRGRTLSHRLRQESQAFHLPRNNSRLSRHHPGEIPFKP